MLLRCYTSETLAEEQWRLSLLAAGGQPHAACSRLLSLKETALTTAASSQIAAQLPQPVNLPKKSCSNAANKDSPTSEILPINLQMGNLSSTYFPPDIFRSFFFFTDCIGFLPDTNPSPAFTHQSPHSSFLCERPVFGGRPCL